MNEESTPANPVDTIPDNQPLNEMEVLLLNGIQAREREMTRLHLEPFQQDLQKIIRMIEGNHQLPVGTIGSTHILDPERMVISLVKEGEGQAVPQAPEQDVTKME